MHAIIRKTKIHWNKKKLHRIVGEINYYISAILINFLSLKFYFSKCTIRSSVTFRNNFFLI